MFDHAKLVCLNIASWVATLISLQNLKDGLQVLALAGSVAVSLASLWWIRRQSQSLDRKDAASRRSRELD